MDRNQVCIVARGLFQQSLSARRAWIEITPKPGKVNVVEPVALRKESVDRNAACTAIASKSDVALRKESVDRNIGPLMFNVQPRSRSPQGERG